MTHLLFYRFRSPSLLYAKLQHLHLDRMDRLGKHLVDTESKCEKIDLNKNIKKKKFHMRDTCETFRWIDFPSAFCYLSNILQNIKVFVFSSRPENRVD